MINNFYTFQILISFCMLCYNSWEEISISFYWQIVSQIESNRFFCQHHHFSPESIRFLLINHSFCHFGEGNKSSQYQIRMYAILQCSGATSSPITKESGESSTPVFFGSHLLQLEPHGMLQIWLLGVAFISFWSFGGATLPGIDPLESSSFSWLLFLSECVSE